MPSHRMGPAALIDLTVVICSNQLCGSKHKCKMGKGWGVVFVCTATPLVHVEMTQSYSTDSFLMALRRFKAKHGAPRRFQSNQGDQLVAADCHMGLIRCGCAVQSEERHLEASANWGASTI